MHLTLLQASFAPRNFLFCPELGRSAVRTLCRRSHALKRSLERRATVIGTVVAATLVVGFQTGASSDTGADVLPDVVIGAAVNPGGLPADLSPAQRTALIKAADADKAATAKALGLG
ncbi:hypothetical protein ACIGBL_34835, partial [Streptomyces sp. NPDC085614]